MHNFEPHPLGSQSSSIILNGVGQPPPNPARSYNNSITVHFMSVPKYLRRHPWPGASRTIIFRTPLPYPHRSRSCQEEKKKMSIHRHPFWFVALADMTKKRSPVNFSSHLTKNFRHNSDRGGFLIWLFPM